MKFLRDVSSVVVSRARGIWSEERSAAIFFYLSTFSSRSLGKKDIEKSSQNRYTYSIERKRGREMPRSER